MGAKFIQNSFFSFQLSARTRAHKFHSAANVLAPTTNDGCTTATIATSVTSGKWPAVARKESAGGHFDRSTKTFGTAHSTAPPPPPPTANHARYPLFLPPSLSFPPRCCSDCIGPSFDAPSFLCCLFWLFIQLCFGDTLFGR